MLRFINMAIAENILRGNERIITDPHSRKLSYTRTPQSFPVTPPESRVILGGIPESFERNEKVIDVLPNGVVIYDSASITKGRSTAEIMENGGLLEQAIVGSLTSEKSPLVWAGTAISAAYDAVKAKIGRVSFEKAQSMSLAEVSPAFDTASRIAMAGAMFISSVGGKGNLKQMAEDPQIDSGGNDNTPNSNGSNTGEIIKTTAKIVATGLGARVLVACKGDPDTSPEVQIVPDTTNIPPTKDLPMGSEESTATPVPLPSLEAGEVAELEATSEAKPTVTPAPEVVPISFDEAAARLFSEGYSSYRLAPVLSQDAFEEVLEPLGVTRLGLTNQISFEAQGLHEASPDGISRLIIPEYVSANDIVSALQDSSGAEQLPFTVVSYEKDMDLGGDGVYLLSVHAGSAGWTTRTWKDAALAEISAGYIIEGTPMMLAQEGSELELHSVPGSKLYGPNVDIAMVEGYSPTLVQVDKDGKVFAVMNTEDSTWNVREGIAPKFPEIAQILPEKWTVDAITDDSGTELLVVKADNGSQVFQVSPDVQIDEQGKFPAWIQVEDERQEVVMSSDEETGKLTASASEGWEFDWNNNEWLKNMEPYYRELIANAPIQDFWEGQTPSFDGYYKARFAFPIYTGEQRTIEMDLARWGRASIDTLVVVVPDPVDPEIIREILVPIYFDKPIPPFINTRGQAVQMNEPILYRGQGVDRSWVKTREEFLQSLKAGDQLEVGYYHRIPDDPFIGPCNPNRQCDWLHDISLAQNHNELFLLADQGEVVDWPDPFTITAFMVVNKFK